MTLDEARRILKGKPGSIDELGPEFVRHARAAEVVGNHYRQHPEQLRPVHQFTTDAPRRTRDVGAPGPYWRTARTNPEVGTGRADMGTDPGSRSGAKLVQVLPGDVSAYFVAADGSGRACLFRTVEADDALDPHRTATGTRVAATADRAKFMRDAQTRAGLEQFRNASIALRTQAFWEDQRDALTHDQQPQDTRGAIERRNAAFWQKGVA